MTTFIPSDFGPSFDIGLDVDPLNVNTCYYFVAAMAGLVVLFTLGNWSSCLFGRYLSKTQSAAARVPVAGLRLIQRFTVRKISGFPSAGHGTIVVVYVAVNIILLFTNLSWDLVSNFGRRLGWVATLNIALLFFLALKNTPLGLLTGYSFERLNFFHQVAGYTAILESFLHTIIFIVARAKQNELFNLNDPLQIPGIWAMSVMLLILWTSLFFRKRWYEAFYIIHVVMAAVVLVGVGKHRPDLSTRSLIIILFAAALWVPDKILRAGKMAVYSRGNKATLTPLPDGGVRVVLARPLPRAQPGTHALLWIPKISPLQTHPFTIVSADPLEFVLAAQDGFTKDLHAYAAKEPGASLEASVDGPYGTLPDFTRCEKLVLIAGGSGATFTFAVALDLVKRLDANSRATIEFVWVVREQSQLSWFPQELATLQSSPLVHLVIHVTRSVDEPKRPPFLVSESNNKFSNNKLSTSLSPTAHDAPDEKLDHIPAMPSARPLDIQFGRPSIAGIVKEVVHSAGQHDRVCVVACGPSSLMHAARRAAAACIGMSGPSVEIHTEQFGW